MCVGLSNVEAQTGASYVSSISPRYSPSSSLSVSPEPEEGGITNEIFSDAYFQLRIPLPAGWEEDVQGPVPSMGGYYTVVRFKTQGGFRGMAFVEAQDMFFADPPIQDAMESSKRKEHQAAFQLQDIIDHPPREIQLAGHRFVRLDYSGGGYRHAAFSTLVRCHVVSIEILSRFPDVFQQAEADMGRISLLDIADPATGGGPVPVCVKDYTTGTTVIHKVDPVMVGLRYTKVPTRFVIDTSGKVKHIHVINALPDQAKSVEDALAQWLFKPYIVNGHPVEVETGILFEFPPTGRGPSVDAVWSH
jgi:hypothetical protein